MIGGFEKMINYKRLALGIALGALAGIVCVSGLSVSLPNASVLFLAGAWYNRLIIGAIIGLAGEIKIIKKEDNIINALIRGIILGFFYNSSFLFLSSRRTYFFYFCRNCLRCFNRYNLYNFDKEQRPKVKQRDF